MSFWIPLFVSGLALSMFTLFILRRIAGLPPDRRRSALALDQIVFYVFVATFAGSMLGFSLGFFFTASDMYAPLIGIHGGGIGSAISSLSILLASRDASNKHGG
jgi:hypothetical protein